MAYDGSIQYFIETAEDRWGTPEKNRVNLVPYGILPLDLALYGLDIGNGEMITIQGEEKKRKTTLIENIVSNYMLRPKKNYHPVTVIDTLEPGMKPAKYADTLIANVASRYLIQKGHMPNPKFPCKLCGDGGPCKELVLSYKFLKFNTRTKAQQEAIAWAMNEMKDWPLYIFGPTPEEGDTRNLEASVVGTKSQKSRWQRLIEEKGAKVFVVDHIQQYSLPVSDYEKMLTVIPAHSDMVARFNIVDFVLSQVSMGSAKDAASGMGKLTAMGGRKAAQESNTILSTIYESGSGRMGVVVEDSRDAGSGWGLWLPIEENSGAFYEIPNSQWGEVRRVERIMRNGGNNGSAANQTNGRKQ